jgi:hypothetical protein
MGTNQSHRPPIHRNHSRLEPGRKTIGAGRSTAEEFWHPAPAGSHLESFKLVDARLRTQTHLPDVAGARSGAGGLLTGALAFLGELWPRRRRAAPVNGADEPNSSLFIRYAGGGEYEYFTSDHDYLESVYALMCNAPRPGEIVWSHLIGRQVPCRRVD